MLSFFDLCYVGNPSNVDFHRAIIKEVENRMATISLSYTELEATLEHVNSFSKYGYGAIYLYPYGYYHPTRILDKISSEYKRGRILTKCKADKEPKYRYFFSNKENLLAIEAIVSPRRGWPNAKVLTFVYSCTSAESIYLTFTTRNKEEELPTLTNVACEINKNDQTFIHIIDGYCREENFVGYRLETEIHYHESDICERCEYTFEPSIGRKTSHLVRHVYDMQRNV